jgi:hypothetical protein
LIDVPTGIFAQPILNVGEGHEHESLL